MTRTTASPGTPYCVPPTNSSRRPVSRGRNGVGPKSPASHQPRTKSGSDHSRPGLTARPLTPSGSSFQSRLGRPSRPHWPSLLRGFTVNFLWLQPAPAVPTAIAYRESAGPHGSKRRRPPVLGSIILPNATSAIGGRGFARQLRDQADGIAHPAIPCCHRHATALHEPAETHVSQTWQPGSFARHTRQSKLTDTVIAPARRLCSKWGARDERTKPFNGVTAYGSIYRI